MYSLTWFLHRCGLVVDMDIVFWITVRAGMPQQLRAVVLLHMDWLGKMQQPSHTMTEGLF